MASKIYHVETMGDESVKVIFFDGSVRKLDVRGLSEYAPEYIAVLGEDVFPKAAVDKSKGKLVWPNGISISAESIIGNSIHIEVISIKDAAVNFAERLRAVRECSFLTQKELGQRSGVDQADISKIERAEVNPSLATMAKLMAGTGHSLHFTPEQDRRQGTYRVWDLEYLPTDKHKYWELINGELYPMPLPSIKHQYILSKVFGDIAIFLRDRGGDCLVFPTATGVQFPDDDTNFLIPDLLVLCDRSKLRDGGILGAPDFVLEVLSKSNAKNDTVRKLHIYMEKGVREYWIMDPIRECLVIYDFEEDALPEVHFFDEEVPIGIFEGELKINLRRFKGEIS